MKAAVLSGPLDVRIETVATPSIRNNEVLVKVRAAGICGSDMHNYKTGDKPVAYQPTPVILGHELSGEVVEVGAVVQGLTVGDKVLGTGIGKCGTCRWCQQGRSDLCPNVGLPGYGRSGAFAEYVAVPNPQLGKTLFKKPESMSWNEAATIEPLCVSCFAVEQAMIQPNQTVVVLGAGMIGQGVAQVAKAKGAARVIVSEPSVKRLAMAKKLGADVALNPKEVDVIKAVMEANSGKKVAVVFECSGVPDAFRQALQMVQPYGKVMQVAVFEKNVEISSDLMSLMTHTNVSVRGCGGQRWEMAFELVRSGQVKTADLVTHEFSLDDAKKAFDTQLNSDEAIKVLIKP